MNTSGYQLIDSGDQLKLERFGAFVLTRPASQAVWPRRNLATWHKVDASFERNSSGSGNWRIESTLPPCWSMQYFNFTFTLRPNEHGNVGIFPEQEPCWSWIIATVKAVAPPIKSFDVLNLFGYTGGSTLAALAAGANVVHVDASRTSVQAARENVAASGLGDRSVRWIVEDAGKFVERELRRARRYHGIVLDPPSYGRGTNGEIWQIERDLVPLLANCQRLLHEDARFLLLTSHTPGFTPLVLANLLEAPSGVAADCGEMLLRDTRERALPSGAFARWRRT
ncbi:MAG: class I SAM-dependent methyltransferase [Planctomycetota bacterium]